MSRRNILCVLLTGLCFLFLAPNLLLADDYPNKPHPTPKAGTLFAQAATELGYHPYPIPSANMSAPYTNPEGATLNACQYCGHCDRFGCAVNAKASPNATLHPALLGDPRFELRDHAYVKQLVYDKSARKVTLTAGSSDRGAIKRC